MRLSVKELRGVTELLAEGRLDEWRRKYAELEKRHAELNAERSRTSGSDLSVCGRLDDLALLLRATSKGEAVKAHRQMTMMTVRDSKDWIESNDPRFPAVNQ